MWSRIAEWGLRGWAVVQVLVAGLWLLGPYGAGVVSGSQVGNFAMTRIDGLFTGPTVGARLLDPSAAGQMFDLSQSLTGYNGQALTGAYGDINVGWHVQFSILTGTQGWIWVLLHVVPLLALALLWWLLADAVVQSRDGSVFTPRTATRLLWGGGIILAGSVVLSVATWWFYEWIAGASQLADRIEVPGYTWEHLPWPAIAVGVALMALGHAWKRGVAAEHELSGLV